MKKEIYIRQLKQLIKKYHPDLCKNEYLGNIYNEITIKLNQKLNQYNKDNFNEPLKKTNFDKTASADKSLINISNPDFVYYKLGIKYYRNIHPNKFFINKDKTFQPKAFEDQLKILNNIYISFNCSRYYFTKVLAEYPNSEWAADAGEKLKLLKKLYKSYQNMDVENNTQIKDSHKFINEMGLKLLTL